MQGHDQECHVSRAVAASHVDEGGGVHDDGADDGDDTCWYVVGDENGDGNVLVTARMAQVIALVVMLIAQLQVLVGRLFVQAMPVLVRVGRAGTISVRCSNTANKPADQPREPNTPKFRNIA